MQIETLVSIGCYDKLFKIYGRGCWRGLKVRGGGVWGIGYIPFVRVLSNHQPPSLRKV